LADLWRAALALTRHFAAIAFSLLSVGCPRAEGERAAPATSRQPLPAHAASGPTSEGVEASGEAVTAPAAGLTSEAKPDAPPSLAPLVGPPVANLEVPGFSAAVVALPVGATAPRPVVVALHGNFDRPDWQCGVWAPIVAARAFVLCPRGVARRDVPKDWDRWEYASAKAVAKELDAALAALRQRYPDYVDPGPALFIGFSLGAIYGVSLVQKAPERFPRAVMIEGGLGAWSAAAAKRYVSAGGQRLLLACGQPDCMARVKTLGPALERAGLPTRTGGSPRAGHTYDGPVAEVVATNWDWLVEGDPRFSK
jgi:predicted esterase